MKVSRQAGAPACKMLSAHSHEGLLKMEAQNSSGKAQGTQYKPTHEHCIPPANHPVLATFKKPRCCKTL
eukprot:1152084-Pelagomonas_calceolata.AAC.7